MVKGKGYYAGYVRAYRHALSLTQEELASQLGLSQALVSQIERGVLKRTKCWFEDKLSQILPKGGF